jgi:hypothetical protein
LGVAEGGRYGLTEGDVPREGFILAAAMLPAAAARRVERIGPTAAACMQGAYMYTSHSITVYTTQITRIQNWDFRPLVILTTR